ncbi:HAD hydrolase-like protein [Candidatus Woesearchaeota archaeon]|nr:HAD hydrolase-like protein [Candidatus Woesearchaeota archaeon]
MIKLIIFDLDNTLFDTYGQLGKNILEQMIHRMKKAGLKKEHEEIMREKYPFLGFRILARELKLSAKLQEIGMSVYKDMDLSGIKPFDDIHVLDELEQKKALVTSGTEEVQIKKIKILGIQHYFQDMVVDKSVSYEGRVNIFSELMKKYKLKPSEVLVIGDLPQVELAAGKSIGMVAVQIIRRDNVLKGEADYRIKDFYELKSIVEELGRKP